MPMIELPKYASVDINATALKIDVRCTCRADFDQVIAFLTRARELFGAAPELLPEPKEAIWANDYDLAVSSWPFDGTPAVEDIIAIVASVDEQNPNGFPNERDRRIAFYSAWQVRGPGRNPARPPKTRLVIFDPENASSEVGGIPPTIGPETAIEAPYEDPF